MPLTIRFAINRICGSRMPFADFAAMAQRLGVQGIELRNDLPAVELRDKAAARTIGAIASDHGLTIRAINALQRFDQLTGGRQSEAAALAQYASECGAQALVLCPTNQRHDSRDPRQRHDDLVHALHGLQPVLAGYGLTGLIEPLGFAESAVRRKCQAQRAIDVLGVTAPFALVHDTFHHHLASERDFYPQYTGLVHISGVDDTTLRVDQMRDTHRQLVGPQDRLGNVAQLQRLLADGYTGYVSFEPFAGAVTHSADIEQQLRESMDYLCAAVAASTGTEGSSVR
ncbi:MAG: TIM barrel protein [Burkholderiaceae bacterium]